jgi:cytoskeletal protein RodZ
MRIAVKLKEKDKNPQWRRLAMEEKKGLVWKVTTAVLAVLLAGAIAAIVILAVTSNNTRNKDRASIAKLEKKAVDLEKEVANLKAEDAALASSASSATSSATTEQKTTQSDEDIVNAMALERAKASYPDIPWTTGGTKVIGDWARVGIDAPREYNMQGESMYFHKVNGKWAFVDEGTGLTPEQIPGCPEELFNP